MLRKTTAFILALLLLFPSGCGLPRPARIPAYYNGYLGLAVQLPGGWEILSRNGSNMTPEAEASESYELLEKEYYGDGGAYIALLETDNSRNPADEEYVRIDFFAEDYRDLFPTLGEYAEACINGYTGTTEDGAYAEFVGQDEKTVGGTIYTRLRFEGRQAFDGAPFVEHYYICEVGTLYFTVRLQAYSAEQEPEAFHAMATCFTLLPDSPAREEQAKREPEEYYNGYLGLTVKLPEDLYWTVHDGNLTSDYADSELLASMAPQEYMDGGLYYDLIRIQNAYLENGTDFASLDLLAEYYPFFDTPEEFLDASVEAYTEGNPERLAERVEVELNGVRYTKLVIAASSAGDYRSGGSVEEYYIRQVRELYFIACARYRADSDKGRDDALRILNECFIFALPGLERI